MSYELFSAGLSFVTLGVLLYGMSIEIKNKTRIEDLKKELEEHKKELEELKNKIKKLKGRFYCGR